MFNEYYYTDNSRSDSLEVSKRLEVFANGSLLINDVRGTDAANYTCRTENIYGADEIKITLIVQGRYSNLVKMYREQSFCQNLMLAKRYNLFSFFLSFLD